MKMIKLIWGSLSVYRTRCFWASHSNRYYPCAYFLRRK